ncbi:MAG: hypothetical protein ACREKE_02690 [bacterium]
MNYRVTIEYADETGEIHEVPQAEAYALVLDELDNPTKGRTSLRIESILPGGAA